MISVFARRSLSATRFTNATPSRLGGGVRQHYPNLKVHASNTSITGTPALFLKPPSPNVRFFSTKSFALTTPFKPLGLPSLVLLGGSVVTVGSILTARELCREFVPPEIWQETMDKCEEEEHLPYPMTRLLVEPIAYTVFSALIALGYKLEPSSRRGKIPWVPRFGSPAAAFCITGAIVATCRAVEHVCYSNEEACKDLYGCVLHIDDSLEKHDMEWFKTTGAMDMTPRQRKVFLREKWIYFGKSVFVGSVLVNVFFQHVIFRNLVGMTNPAAAVCINGLTFFVLTYDKHYVPVDVTLGTMVWSLAYFATGRLAVPVVADVICAFCDVQREPATLPFALSFGGTTN